MNAIRSVVASGLALCFITGCLIPSDDDPPPRPTKPPAQPGDPLPPPPPPPPPQPPSGSSLFNFEQLDLRMGVGLTTELSYQASRPLADFELESSDPSIVEVVVDGDDIVVQPRARGAATVTVRASGSPNVLDQVVVTGIDVSTIDLFFRTLPVAAAPQASLAAVVGDDTVGIAYRSATGEFLIGRGTYTTRGSAVALASSGPGRLSEWFESRDRVHLSFPQLGSGALIATLGNGRTKEWPIEVIAAPATLSLVGLVLRSGGLALAPEVCGLDEPTGWDIIGRAADGRFVAGLLATFTTTLSPGSGWPTSEIVFWTPKTPTSVTVTATVGTRVLSRTFSVQ